MSLQVIAPLVAQIVSQAHEPPNAALIRSLQLTTRRERDVRLDDELDDLKNSLPGKTKRAVDPAAEKGGSSWLTVIPLNTGHHLIRVLNKRRVTDVGNLCPLWLVILELD